MRKTIVALCALLTLSGQLMAMPEILPMRERAAVIDQWLETVRPMHLECVEPSKRYADLIIPEGGFNTVALDLIISRIEQQLPST